MLQRTAPKQVLRIAIVVKGYPRLSETFIAQEILALEREGFELDLWSLRRPTDGTVHAMHHEIAAGVAYLPEYLYREPLRVLRALVWSFGRFTDLVRTLGLFLPDLARDPTPNRVRRFGQGLVLARELAPDVAHVHVHYLHTPASVVRYAARLTGRSFSFSGHAKDIWTIPDWEKREKIADARFGVTCTRFGADELRRLSPRGEEKKVALVYHGLDLSRFPPPPERPRATGTPDPVVIASVGRLVAKKGFDDLIEALGRLDRGLAWRFVHVGSGPQLPTLRARAEGLGLGDRISWRGSQPQERVIEALREADLFALPCKEGEDGDRDGLPNVILEAATQALPIVSTDYAGVPEFIENGRSGLLVAPGDVEALAAAIERLIRDPDRREALGRAAHGRIATAFSFEAGIQEIGSRLSACLRAEAATP